MQDLELLFEEPPVAPGCSPVPPDFDFEFEEYTQWDKAYGRLEKRKITTSSMLADYTPWPHLAQVFKLESWRSDPRGHTTYAVRYGLTSLPSEVANPKRLLALVRGE